MTNQQKNAGLYSLKVIKRLCLLLIVCVIFFGIVFNIGKISADDFKRMFVRIGNGLSADAQETNGEIAVSDDPTMSALKFKDGVAVSTSDRLRVFDRSGIEFFSNKLVMADPIMRVTDKRIMIFDRGGKSIGVYTSFACIGEIKTENEIINASVNDKGYIAVATQADGYKSMVTMYNANMAEKYKYYSADGYILNTAVYGSGKQLACSALLAGGNKCRITAYNTSSEEPLCSVTLNSCFVYKLDYIAKDKLIAVTDTGWYLINTAENAVISSKAYSGASLSCFCADGTKGVFVFSDNGNRSSVSICDFIADTDSEFTVNGAVQSIAVNENKIALCASGKLICCDMTGNELFTAETAARRIVDVMGKYIIISRSGGISYIKIQENQ